MKKIFTTLAAVAMVALTANAAIEVKVNGEAANNGDVFNFGNEAFKYTEIDLGPNGVLTDWTAEFEIEVECGNPCKASAETNYTLFSFCPDNCIVWPSVPENGVYKVSTIIEKGSFGGPMIHLTFDTKELPEVEGWIKCIFEDDDNEPFELTFKVKTDASAVEEIDMDNVKVAAVYDMLGRRVRDDFRGTAIVVLENGKALKQIRK